jgi:hypothetical protein
MDHVEADETLSLQMRDVVTTEQAIDLRLDSGGDAIIVVEDSITNESKSFLVSSKVLSLASPVFLGLFEPHFTEGIRTRRGDCPTIHLKEDDPNAMTIIFNAVHHKTLDVPDQIEPKRLAILAKNCDKYDCTRALRLWISRWCDFYFVPNQENLGYMLLATYLFHSEKFSSIAADAARHLIPGFSSSWKHEILLALPKHIQG